MTANVYDTLGSPTQLGADLQTYSSNGWPPAWGAYTAQSAYPNGKTYWDGETPKGNPNIPGYASIFSQDTFVDMILHNSEIHVAWVEPQWDGTKKVMRGPFVKRWHGGAWVSLGGEVDPSITAVQESQYPNPSGAVGTRAAPARPVLASDGTDLYCAYTVREVASVVEAVPNGVYVSGFPCGCYTPVCNATDYSHWTPRKCYLRKWNSGAGTWDLYGDIPAATNNVLGSTTSGFVTDPNGSVFMSTCASTADPGVVYVAWCEGGTHAAIGNYSVAPACIFGIQFGTPTTPSASLITTVTRFDGSDTVGVTKTLDNVSHGIRVSGPSYNTSGPWPAFVDNSTGTPWVFWCPSHLFGFPGGPQLHMTDWDTLVDAQIDSTTGSTAPGGPYTTCAPFAIAKDDTRGVFYVQISFGGTGYVREVPQDGSSAFEPLDFANVGTTAQIPLGTSGNCFYRRFDGDQGRDVWGIPSVGNVTPTLGGENGSQIQYHFECPSWVAWDYVSGDTDIRVAGAVILLRISNILYAAAAFFDFTNTATDLTIRVYQATIARDSATCGGPVISAQPFILSKHQVGEDEGGATGSTGPFVNTQFEVAST